MTTAVMMKAGVIFLGLYFIFSTVLGQEESTGEHQDGKCTKIAPYVLSNSSVEWKLYYINQSSRFITISIYFRILIFCVLQYLTTKHDTHSTQSAFLSQNVSLTIGFHGDVPHTIGD